MNTNLFDEIYNGLDHAMLCYLDTKAAKAGNVVKIYGTDFGGEFGKAQNLNTVEMYAIYSNRKNKSGKYSRDSTLSSPTSRLVKPRLSRLSPRQWALLLTL